MRVSTGGPEDTADEAYCRRLQDLETAPWKRGLDVQLPYRLHLRSLRLGRTLDVGCGIGRNLRHLSPASVGVDHNAHSVGIARSRGLNAVTTAQYTEQAAAMRGAFDALLCAHVIEHMTRDEAVAMLRSYLPALRPGGRAVLICPQERGFRSDASHVTFVDGRSLAALCEDLRLVARRGYSFPFPRRVGHVFTHNETVLVAEVA